jgi:hypothetical protein
MCFGELWLDAKSLTYTLNGQLTAAYLMAEQAQQMQRSDMLRIHLQDLTVELFRLRNATPLVVLHGHVEGLSNREHELLSEGEQNRPVNRFP